MESLAGRGFVAIWNGIPAEHRQDFIAWHRGEHMPERLAIPGFLSGARWRADAAPLEFFTLYTLVEPAVSLSAAYLARLNDPTPWTRRVTGQFLNNQRCVGAFAASAGTGPGERVLIAPVAQSAVDGGWAGLVEAALAVPGVAGCHAGAADAAGSAITTVERQGRAVQEPQGLVLVALDDGAVLPAVIEQLRPVLPAADWASYSKELALP